MVAADLRENGWPCHMMNGSAAAVPGLAAGLTIALVAVSLTLQLRRRRRQTDRLRAVRIAPENFRDGFFIGARWLEALLFGPEQRGKMI